MADSYIDQDETLAYGDFAVAQIASLAFGLDKDFDKALQAVSKRLHRATAAMRGALAAAGAAPRVTYAHVDDDPVAAARDVLERLAGYATSRKGGKAIREKLLAGQALSTVLRRRPALLAAALVHARAVVEEEKAHLPEAKAWDKELAAAHDALASLTEQVRVSRVERRATTPQVAKAREEWLRVYGAAKLVVEAVLRLHGKEPRLHEIFDDLAVVHRAKGVHDDAAAASALPVPAKAG